MGIPYPNNYHSRIYFIVFYQIATVSLAKNYSTSTFAFSDLISSTLHSISISLLVIEILLDYIHVFLIIDKKY